jgi:hypothetical protein
VTAINAALIGTVETQTFTGFDIAKVSLILPNVEYTYTFPSGTKGFQIQNRNSGAIKLRKVSGGDYWTFFAGQPWFPVNIKGNATISIILESPSPSQTVEVLYWS